MKTTRAIMAFATVLRITLVACLTLFSGTSSVSAVNQTASPYTDVPVYLERVTSTNFLETTLDTFSPEVTTELAPSAVTSDTTTALLTELGLTESTVVDGTSAVPTRNSTKSSGTLSSQNPRDELGTLITSTDVSTTYADQNGSSTERTEPYVPWTESPDGLDPTTIVSGVSRRTTSCNDFFFTSTPLFPDQQNSTQDQETKADDGSLEVGDDKSGVSTLVLSRPVIDLASIQVTPESITLCLVEPVGPEGSINYFLVTKSFLDGTRTWHKGHFLRGSTVCIAKQDLTSAVTYNVSVVARDDDFGWSSSDFINITTVFHKLNFPDPEFQLLDGNETKATVQWFFENQTNINKYIFSYNQTDSYPGGFKQHQPDDLAGSMQSITLYGIYPGARYALNIQAISGPLSTTFNREWFPETEPPSNIRVVEVTANSIRLDWIFPPHTPPILVDNFSISCKAQNYHSKPLMTWYTRQASFLVEDLLPGVTYGCSVVTLSRNGKTSYPQNITVETGVAPPTEVRIRDRTSTTFTLEWNSPMGIYQYVRVTCFQCPWVTKVINSTSNTARFELLKSGIQYNVTLVTFASGSSSSDPMEYSVLTLPVGPSRLIVIILDDIKLKLVWFTNNCQGCAVDFYVATLWTARTSHQVNKKIAPCEARKCDLEFDGLLPGQEYRAEVKADRGGLSSQHPVTDITRIPPGVPGAIIFKTVTHSLLHMAWTPPRGIVDRYIIGICEADQNRYSNACDTYKIWVNSSITDFRCLKLKPSTRYNITLTAKSGDLYSKLRWVVKSTTSHYPEADDNPPKAPSSTDDITPYTFRVTFDTNYFDNSERDILNYTVLIAEAGAVSHATLPTVGNLSEGLKTRTWAVAIGQETIQRYQIAEHFSYADLVAESGKREAYASKTIVIGEESCSEEKKDVYCNGPLKHDKIYVYQFRAFTKTGFSDTPFSRHVVLPEDNTGVVVGISVILVLLFVIVLILISIIMMRKFRGSYGRYKPAQSMEPLPIRMMTRSGRSSTRQRNSRPVLLTDFCHDFQVMNAHCHFGFSQEYEAIVRVGRKLGSNAAVLAANVSKNRYTNILPFDRTRVMLSPVDDVEGSDYINANYIPGYNSPREYIACQGPLPGTVDDTWRMVWEQDVATIVILTQLIEKATVKCDQYWPEDSSPLLYGDIKILMSNKEEMENWCIRDFTLQMNETTKQVRQFHYLAWPDHGVPDSSSTLKSFIHTVQEQIPSNGTPTIVHCSAGVGRTGTFICLDRLMRHMEDYNFVDILSIVCDMRTHRNFMVQTEQQYVFIHKCILEILEEKGIAPKRLPSISSIDTCDMNSRQGSDASAMKLPISEDDEDHDVIMRRNSADSEDESQKRMSMYSMGSPKRLLIEDDACSRSPKKSANGGSNGSLKKCTNGSSNGSPKKCTNGSSNGSPKKCSNGSRNGSLKKHPNGTNTDVGEEIV